MFHWEDDASTGPATDGVGTLIFQVGFFNAAAAAANAFVNGSSLAMQLGQAPDLRRVTFIAHSAGSWVAYRAAERLLESNKYVVVNVVLLDPFVPGVDPTLQTPLTVSMMSSLANHGAQDRIFRLENYYAIDFLTDGDFDWGEGGGARATSQPFGWRGRDINRQVDYIDLPDLAVYGSHDGPKSFFSDTVVASTPGLSAPPPLLNAPDDLAVLGFARGLIEAEDILPRFTFQPTAPSQPWGIGQPLSISVAALRADSFQWFKNGVPYSADTDTLSFAAVSAADAGEYVVRAKNAEGVTFSEKMILHFVQQMDVANIVPATGPTHGGTLVTISGTGFEPGAVVRIGGVQAANVMVVGDSTIYAVTGPHAPGNADVFVANPDTRADTLPAGFYYTDTGSTGPTIDRVDPPVLYTAPCGVSQTLTITGSGFNASTTLVFNYGDGDRASDPARLRFISATTIEYDLFVCLDPDTWTVRAVNGPASSAPVTFQVVNPDTATIVIDGNIPDWAGHQRLVSDPSGDGPFDGNSQYYPGQDFLGLTAAHDPQNLYLLMEFAQNHTGGIALFLDTDLNGNTGCGGAEYVVFVSGDEPGGRLALGDYRSCQIWNAFPRAITSLPPHGVGRFIEAAIPLATLRVLSPDLAGVRISGIAVAPPPAGANDNLGEGFYPLNSFALNDHYTMPQGGALVVPPPALLGNDIFPANADPQVEFVSIPNVNLANLDNGRGGFRLDLSGNPTFTGTLTLRYLFHSYFGRSNLATVTVDVYPQTPPTNTASDDAFTMTEGGTLNLPAPGILSNDSLLPGAPVVQFTAGPQHGSFNNLGGGGFAYFPAAGFSGVDTLQYVVHVDSSTTNEATVRITVNPLPPLVANDDDYSVTQGGTVSVPPPGVFGNDVNVPPAASMELVSFPQNGPFNNQGDGAFTYTPGANFSGTEIFTYRFRSGTRISNVATIRIVVVPLPPLVANDDDYSVTQGSTLGVPPPGVFGNDLNVPPAASMELVSFPQNGPFSNQGDGAFAYTPSANFSGTETLTYRFRSGTRTSNVATIRIVVVPLPPIVANDDAYGVAAGATLVVPAPGLLANDLNVPPAATTQFVAFPQHGNVSNLGNGSIEYTPSSSFSGVETITYMVRSGARTSNVATIAITVTPPPPMIATGDTYDATAGVPLVVSAPGVLANDVSLPPGSFMQIVGFPQNGSVVNTGGGGFQYTANAAFAGTDSFAYIARSGNRFSNEATVSIAVSLPLITATNDAYAATAGMAFEVAPPGVLTNDLNIPADATVQFVVPPQHGGLVNLAGGGFRYTPAAAFGGIDSMTYVVSSGGRTSNEATVTFTVTRPPDVAPPSFAPIANLDAEAASAAGAVVSYPLPLASDAVDGSVTVNCVPASGGIFSVGQTTVACSAGDEAGNVATIDFTVAVLDRTPPAIASAGNHVIEATGAGGAPLLYQSPQTTDAVSGSGVSACTPLSGNVFPLGASLVTCTAHDAAGNSSSSQFEVTVVDTIPPVMSLPANLAVAATEPAGSHVSYSASALDAVDGTVAVTCAPAIGSIFAVGTTTVACSSSDSRGNAASGSFTITVTPYVAPAKPPTIKVNNPVVEATGPGGAIVMINATAHDKRDGRLTPVCAPASGSMFPLGQTTVTCTVTNSQGVTASASALVTVRDTKAPKVQRLANQRVEATSSSGAAVTFTVSADDVADGMLATTCAPPSGSVFPLGRTTVTCSATDRAGNTGSDAFVVHVIDNAAPVIVSVTPSVTVLPNTGRVEPVSLLVLATDLADPSPVCQIVRVTGGGKDLNSDGIVDWTITGPLTLNIEAITRRRKDRTYTITVKCTDASGNASRERTAVVVSRP